MDLPVARVAVEVAHPHLDRLFDYAVPAELAAAAQPGCRVRVRFAGRLVGGFLLAREPASDHPGPLAPLSRVVSTEPVLSPEVAALAGAVAERTGGMLGDVLRLAVPPRHARVEAQPSPVPLARPPPPGPGGWGRYPAGAAFVDGLAAGRSPRAVWSALPGPDWPVEIATAATVALASGRGAVVVVPDSRDAARVDAALRTALGGPGRHVLLTAELGPAERYRRFLALRRGSVAAVVGTRAAAYAPVRDLGLVAIWDDGDDLHDEPRAPYGTARDVLLLRAHLTGAAVLVGGFAPSVEAYSLVSTGWARPLSADRITVRAVAPRISAAGSDAALARDPAARTSRLPTVAWEAARDGLRDGSVLVQVPRRGYQPALACRDCRAAARCPHCGGPIGRGALSAVPACRWCGRPAADWRCRECDGEGLRTAVVGSGRTAEELGRAFPGVQVRTSGGDSVLAGVGAEPALVIATPGAEPVAEGGYAVVLLLDGWAMLGRPGLRTTEETLRRWMNAAALARPAPRGRVVVVADAGLPVVQALVRWSPQAQAGREAAERAALGFPPASRLAAVDGGVEPLGDVLRALTTDAELPNGVEVLGPVPLAEERERALVRVPRSDGAALARALKRVLAGRSARKALESIRVELDPREPL
jgi:primosomal protein N' (replication factor Y) (superfamily II helicase)